MRTLSKRVKDLAIDSGLVDDWNRFLVFYREGQLTSEYQFGFDPVFLTVISFCWKSTRKSKQFSLPEDSLCPALSGLLAKLRVCTFNFHITEGESCCKKLQFRFLPAVGGLTVTRLLHLSSPLRRKRWAIFLICAKRKYWELFLWSNLSSLHIWWRTWIFCLSGEKLDGNEAPISNLCVGSFCAGLGLALRKFDYSQTPM